VLRCEAEGRGGQTVEDTGQLTKKRMEDHRRREAKLALAKDFITRNKNAGMSGSQCCQPRRNGKRVLV
jgi:hypothetical protein